ncbi:MAG: MarR family transcriptional regulator [Deltaproteobacteria bacterium]|nr:MarR family transcriptional regulator [Deltaproteobacteria bacterium]
MKTTHYTLKNYTMDESVGFLLKQAAGVIEKRLAAELRKKCPESTTAQWVILMLVGNGKCRTAAELSEAMSTDMGSVTRMLDRLETKGLVKRTRSTKDRRLVDLSLTEAGEELFPHLPEASINALNALLGGFTKDEVGELKALLRRLIEAGNSCDG